MSDDRHLVLWSMTLLTVAVITLSYCAFSGVVDPNKDKSGNCWNVQDCVEKG